MPATPANTEVNSEHWRHRHRFARRAVVNAEIDSVEGSP
jgi:hypothetical protein